MLSLPLFYYPTTIISIDDDPLFNSAVMDTLKRDGYNIKTFDHPQNGLKFFQNYSSLLTKTSFLQSFVEHEYYDTLHHTPVDFDISNLIKFSNQENKYNEVGVLIVDYDMPYMNGLQLCEELRDLPIKKILLTSKAGYSEAVNAFNGKLIDYYIEKQKSRTLIEDLKKYLNDLEKQYFIDRTLFLSKHLEAEQSLPISDPIFVDFFSKWIINNHIKEYYLVDKNGSFLLINDRKEKFYFVVHTDTSLEDFIKTYEDDSNITPVIESIRNRRSIPFFGVKNPNSIALADWKKFLYTPAIIQSQEKYYWRCIPEQLLAC